MSEKHDAYPQVRIKPTLMQEIMTARLKLEYTVSVPAFVETLLVRGLKEEKKVQDGRKR